MSNSLSQQLFSLIRTLSKGEKRQFKLYASRNFSEKHPKFVRLFDVLDKMTELDEEKIRKKMPELSSGLLSNLKAHLYEQLLVSLRLLHRKDPALRIGEIVNFAEILYRKGLYRQSLNQLGKARLLAQELGDEIRLFEILEFEKLIEARNVTHSGPERAAQLIAESSRNAQLLEAERSWSNLALWIYAYYLRAGHTRNKAEYEQLVHQFDAIKSEIQAGPMSIHGRISQHQAHVWFYYVIQEFHLCYKHALKWVAEMDAAPAYIARHPDMYIKGLHNCLSSLFYCNAPSRFQMVYRKLEHFLEAPAGTLNRNTELLSFVYLETAVLNRYILTGKFTEGCQEIPALENRMDPYAKSLDPHRILMFHYKIACLYFGSGDFSKASNYLHRIINHKTSKLREDVQCFARILNLISHYEMGNDELIDTTIRSTFRFLLKMEDMQLVQKAVLGFLRRSVYMDRKALRPEFIALKAELEIIQQDRFQRRPFLYLDLISWLESKIEERLVEPLIQEKQALRR